MRALVLFVFLGLTPVWAISYTVQLFASSDQARASQLQEELAGQGYPAYLLSVPTPQGQVYRIRVGAFGNRAAAALFAEVIPSVEGSTPSPALAEGGVPAISLQSALLEQVDLEATLVQVFPWPVFESSTPQETSEVEASTDSSPDNADSDNTANSDEQEAPVNTGEENTAENDSNEDSVEAESGEATSAGDETTDAEVDQEAQDTDNPAQPTDTLAQTDEPEDVQDIAELMVVRIQPKDASEQASYRVGSLEFAAWKATPQEDGWILRVRSFSVWPDDWQNASEAEREQYRETVLANLSGDLDLTPQQLGPFVFELADKAPFVVLVERFNPETEQVERLRSIGQPRPNQDNLGLTLEGPSSFLGEAVDIPSPDQATVIELNERTPVPETVEGDGWQAGSDGDFVTLMTQDKTWRAAVGQSLWANHSLLISFYDDQLLLYQIQEP
jgi:hypothetical protein